MPSNNSSNNNEPHNEQQRQEEEQDTITHFFHLVEYKLAANRQLENSLLFGSNSDSDDYKAEEDLLMSINNSGLMEGFAAGVTTFVCLVAGPPIMKRVVASRRGAYQLDSLTTTSTTDKPTSKFSNYLLLGARLGVQAFASLVVAAYTTSYFTDEEFMLKQVARAPLVQGRSAVSDGFCKDISREYYAYHSQEYWNQVQSPYLKHLGTFVQNCQRRASMEANIRQERGLSVNTPVSIPPPGVPSNYPIDDDVKQEYESVDGDRDDAGDNDWAEAFVQDQQHYDELGRDK